MDEVIGYLVVSIFIFGGIYGLILQVQHTMVIRKLTKNAKYKRLVIGNYISCLAIAGFLLFFILNVFVNMQLIQSQIVTSNATSIGCFIFIVMLLFSKFVITPRDRNKNKLSV